MPDHYQTLGVEPSASREDIRAAYRQLMQMIHPDRNPGNRQAEAWAQRVNAAYEVLSRPDLRARYDRERQPPSPEPGGPSGNWQKGEKRERSRAPVPDMVLEVSLELVDSGLVHEYRYEDGSRGLIRIPPGVENGERIPATVVDGTPFNLVIEVERHDRFMRLGADLHTELSIHRADAVKRTVVSLGTLRGRVDVPLRPEFLDGETFRARGEGLPLRHDPERRGDLHVSFTLLPTPDRAVSVNLEEVDRGCSRKLSDLGIVARIPPGVAAGSRVYVAATHGRETNLLVNVLPHRNISRRGDDLHLTATATHAAMLLRSNHRLDVLGRHLDLRLRPEYADGREVRLASQGLPNLRNPKRRGDLHASFAVTDEKRGTDEPRSRLGRLARFARRSMTAVLNTVGVAREAIHRSVLAYRTTRYAIEMRWEQILSTLKILALAAAVLGVGVAVYFIIVNIVAILTAIVVCFIVIGLLYSLFVGR